jgi:cytochrome c5
MKRFNRSGMWIWVTLALASMAFAAGQDVRLPEGDGKKILESACTACHGLDGTVRLKMDKAGWEGVVSSMVSNGAQVDAKEFPVLVDYLVKNFGTGAAAQAGSAPNNDAAAKRILEDGCTTCHDLDLVTGLKLGKDEWMNIVNGMIAKGAAVDDKDVPVLVDYLVKMYGPRK